MTEQSIEVEWNPYEHVFHGVKTLRGLHSVTLMLERTQVLLSGVGGKPISDN